MSVNRPERSERTLRRDARRLACRCMLVLLPATPGLAALPAGWAVHTFTGRIHDMESRGSALACATDGGLLFFDPLHREFAAPIADAGCTDGDCLSSNRLRCVSRDADGAYWLGTEASGVVVFRPDEPARRYGRFFSRSTNPGGGLLADSVTCIEAWKGETVYVGTGVGVGQIELAGGIDSYNPDADRRLGTDLKGTVVHDLAVDSLFVWVATDSGVSRYDRSPPYAVQFVPDSLRGPETFALEILDGRLYAGTSVGVFTWQGSSRTWQQVVNADHTPTNPTTPSLQVLSLARLSTGRLFVGSAGAVYTFNGYAWSQLSPPPLFLVGSRRFTSMVALGDTVWTCQHDEAGRGAYLDTWSGADPTWRRWEANAIPASAVQGVSLGPAPTLWVGTELAGIASLDLTEGRWCIYSGNDPLVRPHMTEPAGYVSALIASRDGMVWFHAIPEPNLSSAVDVLAPDADCQHATDGWDRTDPGENGFGGRYWRALEDGDGNLFFLADGDPGAVEPYGGIDVVSADRTRFANLRADVLGGGAVGALAFGTDTGSWERAFVGLNDQGNQGLLLWIRSGQLFPPDSPTSTNFTSLTLPASLDVGQYRDLSVVPGDPNRLWVGTGDGIFEYDVQNRSVLTELRTKTDALPGLLSADIKDLQFDDFGDLWVASVRGLNRLRLAEREAGRSLAVDAFTTIETIRELNAASSVGQLYDPQRALAPLPGPKVLALAYDRASDVLHVATEAGLASVDVPALGRQTTLPLASAVLYPNPVRLDAGQQEVHIARVTGPATVTVFDLEGEIVCEAVVCDGSDCEDAVVWKLGTASCLETEGNYRAASGAYLVRITTAAGSTVRTLVVLR